MCFHIHFIYAIFFLRCFLFWLFCVFVFFVYLFLLLYTAVSFPLLYKFTDHSQLVETQFQSINITSHHIVSSYSLFIALYFFRITPSDHILCSTCSKHNQFPHRNTRNSNRRCFQLGPCLPLDKIRQLNYLSRHIKDHILSARSNVYYVTK